MVISTLMNYLKIKKNSAALIFILVTGLILRLGVLIKYGFNVTLDSDDLSYVNSAINLIKTGTLTYMYRTEPTVLITPGVPLILAGIFKIFDYGSFGMFVAKIVFIIIGIIGVYATYLIGKYLKSVEAGLIAALLIALSIPHILSSNLFLTETPFMTAFLFLIYYSMKLSGTKQMNDFYLLLFFYVICLFFRTTVALYPVLLLPFYLLKKYPIKLMFKQIMIAALFLIILIAPWIYRNYLIVGEFVPLTGLSGSPLLEGTFQGKGYPNSETLDEIRKNLKSEHYSNVYFRIQKEKEIAKERIRTWWNYDKASFLESYLIFKPKKFWTNFYWIEIFNFTIPFVNISHDVVVDIGKISILLLFVLYREKWKENLFIILVFIYFTIIHSVYYSFGRYSHPLIPLLFVFIGCAALFLVNEVKKKLSFLTINKVIR